MSLHSVFTFFESNAENCSILPTSNEIVHFPNSRPSLNDQRQVDTMNLQFKMNIHLFKKQANYFLANSLHRTMEKKQNWSNRSNFLLNETDLFHDH